MSNKIMTKVLSSGFGYGDDGKIYMMQNVEYEDGSIGSQEIDPATLAYVASRVGKRVNIDDLPPLGASYDQ